MKGYTSVDLAMTTKQLKFISHQSVHNISNHTWRGPWNYEFSFADFLYASVCPVYLMFKEYRSDEKLLELSELTGDCILRRKDWRFPWQRYELESQNDVEEQREMINVKLVLAITLCYTSSLSNQVNKSLHVYSIKHVFGIGTNAILFCSNWCA